MHVWTRKQIFHKQFCLAPNQNVISYKNINLLNVGYKESLTRELGSEKMKD